MAGAIDPFDALNVPDEATAPQVEDPFKSLDVPEESVDTIDPFAKLNVPEVGGDLEPSDQDKSDKKESLLFKTLENINRPQYAVSNAIHKAVTEKDFNLASNLWKGLTLEEKTSIGDTLADIVQPESTAGKIALGTLGFVGDVLTDPLTYVGVGLFNRASKALKIAKKTGKAKFIKNLGWVDEAENVLEQYKNFDKFGKLKKGSSAEKALKASRASSAINKTATQGKAVLTFAGKPILNVDPLAKKASSLGAFLREEAPVIAKSLDRLTGVSPRLRPRGVDPKVWNRFLRAKDKAANIRASIETEGIQKSVEVAKAFKKEGLSAEQVANVTKQIEKGLTPDEKGGQIALQFTDELSKRYKDVGTTAKTLIKEKGYRYLPHLLAEKPEILKKLGFGAREFSTLTPSDIQRTVLKFSDGADDYIVSTESGALFKGGKIADQIPKKELDELLDGFAEGKGTGFGFFSEARIDEINDAVGVELFTPDLPTLVATQAQRTAKVIGGDEMFKRMISLGKNADEAKEVFIKSQGKKQLVGSAAPELKGFFFDPAIAKHIDRTHQALINPEEIHKALKVFDSIQNGWKKTATYWNIPFHTRNAISNVWQNSLAGVDNPLDYQRALSLQFRSKYAPEALNAVDKQLMKEFREQGLDNIGIFSGEIKETINEQIDSLFDVAKRRQDEGPIKAGVFALPRIFNKVGGDAGRAVEGNAKLAHFISKRNAGLDPFDAGNSVKKYLFDYGDLTKAEQEVFRRVAPFYTFTRKNIPLQLEALIRHPDRQSRILKLKNNVEVYAGDDKTAGILPEWLKDATPVFVGKKGDKLRYIKLEGFLPVADLNNLSGDQLVQTMVQQLTPVLKAPLEQALNHNFFFGGKITKQEGMKGFTGRGEQDLLWFRVPGRVKHLAGLFRPINEIDKIVGRRYAGTPLHAKLMNFLLGGKLYEYDENELLRKFDRLTEKESQDIKREINFLRREAREKPLVADRNLEDIQILRKSLIKAKREAAKTKREARRGL